MVHFLWTYYTQWYWYNSQDSTCAHAFCAKYSHENAKFGWDKLYVSLCVATRWTRYILPFINLKFSNFSLIIECPTFILVRVLQGTFLWPSRSGRMVKSIVLRNAQSLVWAAPMRKTVPLWWLKVLGAPPLRALITKSNKLNAKFVNTKQANK